MGKTSTVVRLAVACASAGFRVRIYATDMDADDYVARACARRHGTPPKRLIRGDLDDDDMAHLVETAAWFYDHGIVLDDYRHTTETLTASAIAYRDTYDLLIVDTFNKLVADRRLTSYDQVCQKLDTLNDLRKRLRVPIVCTAQAKDPPTSREIDSSDPLRKPTLNDLEGARRITQDAAGVVLLWRNNYGRPHVEDVRGELNLAKNQRGPVLRLAVGWDERHAEFIPLGKQRELWSYAAKSAKED